MTLAELRATLVIMAAVLLSYGSALLLEDAAHLHVDVVIQSVALSWTLAWTQRTADLTDRIVSLALLPLIAMAAAWTDSLMGEHSAAGDAVFVCAVSFSIWVRRFGPRATRAGTLAALPFVAILVVQGPIGHPASADPRDGHILWLAVVALMAAAWVVVVQVSAGLAGLGEPTAAPSAARKTGAGSGRARMLPSTRMALQMGVALGAAFAVGHLGYPDHWTWAVLTAFIVCSGARGRGDVVHKGLLRALGAALGTVVATWIAGLFGPREPWAVVLIFVVLALATWLRSLSYAYWAGCVTAAFSLLYGYFGQTDAGLMRERLQAIVVGAAIGIVASWLIAPVRTVDVVRRRVADALGALADVLGGQHGEHGELADRARFDQAVELLGQIARPLEARRALSRHHRRTRTGPHLADAIDAVRACVDPLRTITGAAGPPDVAAVLANITAVRLAIARVSGPAYEPVRVRGEDEPAPAVRAVADIDAALARIATVFPPTPPPPPWQRGG
ncbi:FUSC family protein [Streptomyces sp. NPDC052236]|uniref:FUSC family protein n=1 Tax=Streptomyces sp. NPDC052236 TaxID=3365686 RepID=UPI0037CED28B